MKIKKLHIKNIPLAIIGPVNCISILSKITTTDPLPPISENSTLLNKSLTKILNILDNTHVDCIKFEGDLDSMCCFIDDNILFSFYYDHDLEGFICEEDEYSPTKLVSVNEMMVFSNFVPFVICELCDGAGFYTERDCSVGSASECCGGCEVRHDCECEGVLFEI